MVMLASFLNAREYSVFPLSSFLMTLRATTLPVRVSSALYTRDIPPSAARPIILYLSANNLSAMNITACVADYYNRDIIIPAVLQSERH